MEADTSLKLAIYEFTAEHARAPAVSDLAPIVGLSADQVRAG